MVARPKYPKNYFLIEEIQGKIEQPTSIELVPSEDRKKTYIFDTYTGDIILEIREDEERENLIKFNIEQAIKENQFF